MVRSRHINPAGIVLTDIVGKIGKPVRSRTVVDGVGDRKFTGLLGDVGIDDGLEFGSELNHVCYASRQYAGVCDGANNEPD